jgi:hypothetical protein
MVFRELECYGPQAMNEVEKKGEVSTDIIRPVGPTEDGRGVHVLRARAGRVELGEMRELTEGKPLTGGEVVKITARTDAPALYDVQVQYEVPTPPSLAVAGKPKQITSEAYRSNWERVFRATDTEYAEAAIATRIKGSDASN